MRQILFLQLLLVLISCQREASIEESKSIPVQNKLFGNVYRIDSIAGKEGLSDPFFIVLTQDSLFNAYGYWDYSFPFETELRINKSLEITGPQSKWTIQPNDNGGFWLNMDTIRLLYSIAPGKYDSAYKHLRVMKMQESLLLGNWELQKDKTEAGDILRCKFQDRNLLQFIRTKTNPHRIAQLITIKDNKIDTCLRRSFRLNGSDILINDYDTFPPYKIIKLDKDYLIIQDWERLLYFKRVD